MKTYSDSTLKGMKKDDLIAIIRCLEHNISVVEECNQNQFSILMRERVRKDKYRWHDLRKNPEDLPPDSDGYIPKSYDMVVVYNKGTDDEVTIQGQGWWNELWGEEGTGFIQIATQLTSVKLSHYPDKPIPFSREQLIAWREIEPFEGEVNE